MGQGSSIENGNSNNSPTPLSDKSNIENKTADIRVTVEVKGKKVEVKLVQGEKIILKEVNVFALKKDDKKHEQKGALVLFKRICNIAKQEFKNNSFQVLKDKVVVDQEINDETEANGEWVVLELKKPKLLLTINNDKKEFELEQGKNLIQVIPNTKEYALLPYFLEQIIPITSHLLTENKVSENIKFDIKTDWNTIYTIESNFIPIKIVFNESEEEYFIPNNITTDIVSSAFIKHKQQRYGLDFVCFSNKVDADFVDYNEFQKNILCANNFLYIGNFIRLNVTYEDVNKIKFYGNIVAFNRKITPQKIFEILGWNDFIEEIIVLNEGEINFKTEQYLNTKTQISEFNFRATSKQKKINDTVLIFTSYGPRKAPKTNFNPKNIVGKSQYEDQVNGFCIIDKSITDLPNVSKLDSTIENVEQNINLIFTTSENTFFNTSMGNNNISNKTGSITSQGCIANKYYDNFYIETSARVLSNLALKHLGKIKNKEIDAKGELDDFLEPKSLKSESLNLPSLGSFSLCSKNSLIEVLGVGGIDQTSMPCWEKITSRPIAKCIAYSSYVYLGTDSRTHDQFPGTRFVFFVWELLKDLYFCATFLTNHYKEIVDFLGWSYM